MEPDLKAMDDAPLLHTHALEVHPVSLDAFQGEELEGLRLHLPPALSHLLSPPVVGSRADSTAAG